MKARAKKTSRKRPVVSVPTTAPAQPRFEADLLTRGEAQELSPDGKLPLDATHAITKKPDGTLQLKRGRFKLI